MTSYDRIAGLSFKLPTWLAKNHYRENTSRFAERARVGVCVFGKRGGGGGWGRGMCRLNLKIGTFKDRILKHFQQMHVSQPDKTNLNPQ